tara:strand:+ start:1554 stop:2363 length:810 start_codon:yes stop_codon:yes gene_type:complete
MQKIPFVKMHGLGNDFVIISEDKLPKGIDISDFVVLVADRRQGVGCDQFITYRYSDNANIYMGIYNQDGSKALACGNASRCLSRLMFELTGVKNITLNVAERGVKCEYINPDEIKVDMGPAKFVADWMPSQTALWELAERYLIEPKEMLCVDVANPHLVIFSKLSDQDRKIIGQNFQQIDLFKDGVNVNFATVADDKIHLSVWERGAGFTHACGSGAVATFAAATKLGFAGDKAEIIFALGSLAMQKEVDNIIMNGPAAHVFSGEFIYE